MNSHAAHTEPATHEKAQELLPWLRACGLDDPQFAAVQAHVAGCAQCQADMAWQDKLRAAAPSASTECNPDRAFASLLPRLGPQERPVSVLQKWRSAAAANNAWLRWTAGVQLAVIAALALMLARPPLDAGGYRALGAAPQGDVVLVFKPDTAEREMRRILQQGGARVVDGPTATGAWILAVPPGRADALLVRLRAEPAVALAQPLSAGSQP